MSTNPGHVWKDLHEAQLRGNPVHGTRIKTGSLAKSPQAQYQLNQVCAMHRAWTCTTFIIWNSSQQSEKNWKNKTSSKLGTFLDMEGTNTKLLCKVVFTLEKNGTLTEDACQWKVSHYKKNYKGVGQLVKPAKICTLRDKEILDKQSKTLWGKAVRHSGKESHVPHDSTLVKWTESAQPTAIASHSKLSSFSFISPNCHSESSQFNET